MISQFNFLSLHRLVVVVLVALLLVAARPPLLAPAAATTTTTTTTAAAAVAAEMMTDDATTILESSSKIFHRHTEQKGEEPPPLESKSEWYQRYPQYPEYCSTPDQMDRRKIPPLFGSGSGSGGNRDGGNKGNVGDTRLVHVTAILRHGARTIAEGPSEGTNYQCWDDYWTNEETAIWNCPLKTLSMPPSPERIQEEEVDGGGGGGGGGVEGWQDEFPRSMFLFTKDYNALKAPLSNVLNGTCQQGQLLLQGYEQHIKNGQILRDAYLNNKKGEYSSDDRMHLFQVAGGGDDNDDDDNNDVPAEPWADETQLYLRSDDSHATLTSGQLLLRGLFEAELIRSRKFKKQQHAMNANAFPSIPVHTADYSRDILGGFKEQCHALTELQQASDQSWEYQQFVQSDEVTQVLEFVKKHMYDEPSMLDCLMTTICTDRPLPDRFGIYNPHPNSWFNRIAKYKVKNHTFHLNYNDAEYSKLSMGPLWAEIMDHIAPILGKFVETQDRPRPPSKLAIYSGYDSTIMEILASLGAWDEDEEWPPYASMILLEIHELMDENNDKSIYESSFAFRLLYNGEILTDKIKGCTEGLELCDAQHLTNRVQTFARRNIDCIDVHLEREVIHPMEIAKALITTTGGIVLVLLIVAVSALIGSIAVFYRLTGTVPTEELKTLKRKVFRGKNRGGVGGFNGDDPNDSSDHRTSMVLDEHVEMTMSDAAATMDDNFDDEPQHYQAR